MTAGAEGFSDEQLAALDLRESVAVMAGAGSGKTRVLVERYVRALEDVGGDVDRVVAVTFTEKAAAELRGRIRGRLRALAAAAGEGVARDRLRARAARFGEAWIGTIHALAKRLLARVGPESGRAAPRRVADEDESAELAAEAVGATLDRIADGRGAAEEAAALERALRGSPRRRLTAILGGLLARRERATAWADDALRRGFDDERTLLKRAVLEANADEERRRAAAFARIVADADDPRRRAFLRAADELARRWPPPAKKAFNPDLFAAATANLAAALGAFDVTAARTALDDARAVLDAKPGKNRSDEAAAALIAAQRKLSVLAPGAAEPLAPADEALDRGAHAYAAAVARLYFAARADYLGRLSAADAVDFHGLLEDADRLLDDEATRRRFAAQFRHVLVDEFQDTDPLQWRLFRRLFGDAGVARPGLGLVGDAKQSIYGFRGGDVATFRAAVAETAAAKDARGARVGARRELADNYRSSAGLVAFVNALQRALFPPEPEARSFEAFPQPMQARRTEVEGAASRVEVLVVDRAGGDDDEELSAAEREARCVATRLRTLIDDPPRVLDAGTRTSRPARADDVAVLLRTRRDLARYESALAAAQVPFRTLGGDGLFDRQETAWLLSAAAWLADADDDAAFLAVARSPLGGVPDSALLAAVARAAAAGRRGDPLYAKFAALAEAAGADATVLPTPADAPRVAAAAARFARWRKLSRLLPAHEVLAAAIEDADLRFVLDVVDRDGRAAANLSAIVDVVRVAGMRGDASPASAVKALAEFLRDGRRGRQADPPDDGRAAVTILTEHGAKGLEWPIVVLVGAGDDLAKAPHDGTEPPMRCGDGGPWLASFSVRDAGADAEEGKGTAALLLARRRAAERAAEQSRLFYVAATRARDQLIVVGTPPRSAKASTRLAALEEAAPDDDATFGAGPGAARFVRRRVAPASATCAARTAAPEAPAGVAPPHRPPPASPVVLVSADLAGRVAACARRVYFECVAKAPSAPAAIKPALREAGDDEEVESRGADARSRGVVIHAAFEALAFDGDPEAKASDAALALGLDADVRAATVGDAVRAVVRFRASPAGRRLAEAPRRGVFAEASFTLGRGAVRWIGRPDLVIADDVGALVVDYKSSAPRDEAAARRAAVERGYAAQVEIYAAAARRAFRVPTAAVLYFAGSDVTTSIVGGETGRDVDVVAREWEARAEALGQAAAAGFPLTDDPRACVECPHRASGRCEGAGESREVSARRGRA